MSTAHQITGPWHPTVQPVVEEIMRTQAVPGLVIAVMRGNHLPEHLVVGKTWAILGVRTLERWWRRWPANRPPNRLILSTAFNQ